MSACTGTPRNRRRRETEAGLKHFRRWGAVYILVVLFLGSWLGQALAMMPEIESEGMTRFWASTFENWQSEWLQLIFQAVLLLGAKHWLFRVDAEDMERIENKLDRLLEAAGQGDAVHPEDEPKPQR